MKCQVCGQNEATVHYQETRNGAVQQLHLCTHCAQSSPLAGNLAQAVSHMDSGIDHFFTHAFAPLSDASFFPLFTNMADLREPTCPDCGLTQSQLRSSGRTGCPTCYQTFSAILRPYLRQIHGTHTHLPSTATSDAPANTVATAPASDTHTHHTPANATAIATLRMAQQQAIAHEDYEQAARLRDEIKRLEGGEDACNPSA